MPKCLADCSIAIVGLGLMGASLAFDLTHNKLVREVRGVDLNTSTLLKAFTAGVVDLATDDLASGISGADIVIFATPVRSTLAMICEIATHVRPNTVVMDIGSTKSQICAALAQLPLEIQAIGGHPMTGKEVAGFDFAEAGMFRGKPWVLSPLATTSEATECLVTELVKAVGATPITLAADRHDRLVASISHMPFLVASALVHAVDQAGKSDSEVWNLAAGGFRDTSRIAASDTTMFLDILMTNRDAILAEVDTFLYHMTELRELLLQGDELALREKLVHSRNRRKWWRA